jgi:hypothetical protein
MPQNDMLARNCGQRKAQSEEELAPCRGSAGSGEITMRLTARPAGDQK